jgi:hypothetical protein
LKRFSTLLLVAVVATACDELFEEPADPEAYLRFGWPGAEISVAQGSAESVNVTIERRDGFNKAIRVGVQGAPPGVTIDVRASTAGEVTTFVTTFRVDRSVLVGSYACVVRVRAERLRDSDRRITLRVVEPPSYTMTTSPREVRIVRGGVAPMTVNVARTSFGAPITLSLDAAQGITAAFLTNPITANRGDALISAGSDAPLGTHAMTLRAAAAPLADRTGSLSVTVTDDHLQVIADSVVSALQGATIRQTIIVNRSASVASVALSAENLPSGVSATFAAGAPHEQVMSLAVSPATAVGTYPVIIRASGNGVPDVTADFRLTVGRSGVAIKAEPESLSVFQGTSASATLTFQRIALDTTVAITFPNVPSGFTVAVAPPNVAGTSASLTIGTASTVSPGAYDIPIAATPAGWPSDAATMTSLRVNVRAVLPGGGNVILDWSACAPPQWVAAQDGNSWKQVLPVAGLFQFTVTSSRGAFAYVERDSVVVRYQTQVELTARPHDMCPPARSSKVVTGRAIHSFQTEQVNHSFGGATASSRGDNPDFRLTGVRDGVHDLVAWRPAAGARGLIRRDIDVEDGGSLGFVEITALSRSGPPSRISLRPADCSTANPSRTR